MYHPTPHFDMLQTFFPGHNQDACGRREINALRKLGGHPNIIGLVAICTDAKQGLHMVMKRAHHDLSGLLRDENVFFSLSSGQLKVKKTRSPPPSWVFR